MWVYERVRVGGQREKERKESDTDECVDVIKCVCVCVRENVCVKQSVRGLPGDSDI